MDEIIKHMDAKLTARGFSPNPHPNAWPHSWVLDVPNTNRQEIEELSKRLFNELTADETIISNTLLSEIDDETKKGTVIFRYKPSLSYIFDWSPSKLFRDGRKLKPIPAKAKTFTP